MKKVVAGMDLHSNNVVIGIMDMDGMARVGWRAGRRKRVGSEWPLVKASIIARSSLPISAAVGDFNELSARLIKQWVCFWPSFYRPGFAAIRPVGHQISGEVEQQIQPKASAQFSVAGLRDGGAVLP